MGEKDVMFHLTREEANMLVSQNVIPSVKYFGGFLPYVFTQEGIAMLSSVLTSKRATEEVEAGGSGRSGD